MRKKQKNITVPELTQIEEERDRLKYKKRYRSVLKSTIYTLVVVAAIACLVATIWLPFLRIYGASMTPTLEDGEIICCLKGANYDRGDIIAFYYNNKILVKRIIALPGEWVEVKEDGSVYVNDKLLDEPYVQDMSLGECDIEMPYQVPDGRLFVLGDHRSTSIDSRSTTVGCVGDEEVVGELFFRIWPFDRLEIFR